MPFDRDKLIMESARVIVPFIKDLDPRWADSIEIMRVERGFDDLQIIGALCGYTLEMEAHMWIPQHPFFQDTHTPAGREIVCKQCGKEFLAAYPGAFICSNACAALWYGTPPPPVVERKVTEELHQMEMEAANALLPTPAQIEEIETSLGMEEAGEEKERPKGRHRR